jgi:hypothetical protein
VSAFSNTVRVSTVLPKGNLPPVIEEEPYSYSGLNELGGLTDNDEIHGIERDAAIASPLKGKSSMARFIFTFIRTTLTFTSRELSKPNRQRKSLR